MPELDLLKTNDRSSIHKEVLAVLWVTPRTDTISRNADSPCPCQGSPEEGRTSKIPNDDCRLWSSVCLLRAPLDDHKFGV